MNYEKNNMPHSRIPTTGTNVLAPLHEFVITVISYAWVQLANGAWEVVPVRTEVRG